MPNYSGVWTLEQVTDAIQSGNWPRNPSAPTIGTATAGDASATVAFTAPSDAGTGSIVSYNVVSTPGNITGGGSSSPVTVTGLTNGTSYTFAVQAISTVGTGPFSGQSNSVSPVAPVAARGIFSGGRSPTTNPLITIDYVEIATTGNATNFGNLLTAQNFTSSCASSTRGVISGGSISPNQNVIQYITIASTGNSTDFGDLLFSVSQSTSCSSETRGLIAGGATSVRENTIQYITIASVGNALDFGDLITGAMSVSACSSPTRGIFAGGLDNNNVILNTINYVTIASTGNAIDFGNLTQIGRFIASGGCSSSTRGVFGWGSSAASYDNTINYVTIASTGNAIDFGDLSTQTSSRSACSSSIRGLFAGGNTSSGYINNIDYITIATTGNATDFGDLTTANQAASGCSNAHGGLS